MSADSDLATPISMAVEHGVDLKLLHTVKNSGAQEMRKVATYFEEIHRNWLRNNQLPQNYETSKGGVIQRPKEWA